MSQPIIIEVDVVGPIDLTNFVQVEAPIILQATQSGLAMGPPGPEGPPGDTLWEPDTLTTIKPIDSKLIDAAYLTGEIDGGIFQP